MLKGVIYILLLVSASARSVPAAVELLYANISTNLDEWDSDLAIMFYAPWCKYCKQLSPSFDQIAGVLSKSKDLTVGKFNCEVPSKHGEVCKALGIDRYPAVYFIGYGNFNQAADGNFLGASKNPRIVRFTADMYPEAILDWISMLAQVSTWHRKWDDFVGILTGKSRVQRKLEKLEQKIETLQSKAVSLATDNAKFKAIEIFDSLEDHGDPFPALHSAEPDTDNYVMRVCVVEMADEYCKYTEGEPYCELVAACNKKDMTPDYCRPAVCPFENKRGCVVVSQCLTATVLEEYRKALSAMS